MPKIFTSKTQKIGELGESLACKYLEGNGYIILDRNYTRKLGEIDIVASKDKTLYFIEVKSVTRENLTNRGFENLGFRPEENMHPKKLEKFHRVIETYLMERNVVSNWEVVLLCVFIDEKAKRVKVEIIKDIF